MKFMMMLIPCLCCECECQLCLTYMFVLVKLIQPICMFRDFIWYICRLIKGIIRKVSMWKYGIITRKVLTIT